jgi:hypothetical protein
VSDEPGDDAALEGRFDDWVRAAVRQGSVWILVDEEDFNTVLEDPEAERDLHMFFVSEADAASRAEGTSPSELTLDEVAPLFGQIEERGEAVALWDGASWIVAEPSVLADALKQVDL